MNRIIAFVTRRNRWEKEAIDAISVAERAGRKLRVEYERRSIEPRAELDWLIDSIDKLNRLKRGPKQFDK